MTALFSSTDESSSVLATETWHDCWVIEIAQRVKLLQTMLEKSCLMFGLTWQELVLIFIVRTGLCISPVSRIVIRKLFHLCNSKKDQTTMCYISKNLETVSLVAKKRLRPPFLQYPGVGQRAKSKLDRGRPIQESCVFNSVMGSSWALDDDHQGTSLRFHT